jgi:predicted deoxyguanosinetriphosphate triphosphohydrolase
MPIKLSMKKKNSIDYRPSWMTAFEARSPDTPIDENEYRARNAFNRDVGTIVHSNFFKRLSHKTQVFSLPFNDHVHTRLTHSVEASQIGRQIARYFSMRIIKKIIPGDNFHKFSSELEELTSAACLAHDIGHSAFGHVGKEVIQQFCEDNGEKHIFDDNKQVVRILLNDRWFEKIRTSGPFVASILKKMPTQENCNPSELKKLSIIMKKLNLVNLRHPASIFMEAADDIAYLSADLLDFIAIYSSNSAFENKSKFAAFSKLKCIDENGNEIKQTLMTYFNKALEKPVEDNIQNFSDHFLRIALNHVFVAIDEFNNYFMSSNTQTLEDLPLALTNFVKANACKYDKSGKVKKDFNLAYSEAGGKARGKTIFDLKAKIYTGAILNEPFIHEQNKLAKVVLNGILKELYTLTDIDQPDQSDLFKKLPEEVRDYFLVAIKEKTLFPAIIDIVSGMTDRYAISFWKEVVGLSALDRIGARPKLKVA